MIDLLLQITAFVVTVLALVSVHEAGHFFVARALGIKVLRFSIGFGKAIVEHTSKAGIDYRVGILPLGGYVKLLDEREESVPPEQKHLAFNRQALWKRVSVVIAGPITNIVFAIVAYWLMFSIGFTATKPIIDKVLPETPAAVAGVVPQSKILSIDGEPMQTWQDSVFAILGRMGESGTMTMALQPENSEAQKLVTLNLAHWNLDELNPEPLSSLGIQPYRPEIPATINEVTPDGPAAKAGLQVGDTITRVGDTPIQHWMEFVRYVQPRAGHTVQVHYLRNGVEKTTDLSIGTKRILSGFRRIGRVGVMVKPVEMPEAYKMQVQYSLLGAIGPAYHETMKFFGFNVHVFKKMLLGEISLRSLGGPITIFKTANQAFRQGVVIFLRFLAMISVMLAFINILPIPGLDGGHLLMFLIQAIKRGPISIKAEIFAMRLGMSLLLLMMFAATFNDLSRIFR